MDNPILATKLCFPILRNDVVPRLRLVERLNAGLWQEAGFVKKLTLVSAPAGFGKTTLVSEWLHSLSPASPAPGKGPQLQAAWLSLDESDNDPIGFLKTLIACLQQIQPGFGGTTLSILQLPQPPPPNVLLTCLVNELAGSPTPFILALDDYHAIHSPPIHQQLAFILEHQPANMHLVLLTREDPPLPVARLRARGQLLEIRQEDLRFTGAEATEFLNRRMGLLLEADDVAALENHTEGWIAGLQLAALSMQGRADPRAFIQSFTGSSRFILDYLIEEVFERQTPEVKEFLLKTSILERLSGPLCDAVAGRTGSRSLLETLEHANLFIIPLDQTCTWYRYHHLFAELLRQRLHATETFSEIELHRLASQWFVGEGLLPEAIQHALAASDWERAAELIDASSVALLSRGELMTLLGWQRALPEAVIRKYPRLCRDYGWVLTLTGQLDAAAPYLDCAEQAMQGDNEHLGQVIVAQAYLARARGQYSQAIALSKRALGLISEADVLHRGMVTFTLGFAHYNAGHLPEAEQALLEACQATRLSGNHFARLTCLGLLSSIQKNQGKLHRAAEVCRQALQEAQGSAAAAQVQEFLADILYEWDDLDAAADLLAQALKACQYLGNRVIQLEISRAMVRLHQARGDASAALEALQELDKSVQAGDSPGIQALAAFTHAELALAQGDIASASQWARQMAEGVDPAALGLQYGLLNGRLLLAQGDQTHAGEALAGLYESVSQAGLVSSIIEVRALQAMAATRPAEALNFLEEALEKAQPEGFVRTFVDKGEPMKALLERRRAQGGELKEYIHTLLSAFGEKGRLPTAQALVEPISEREVEILRLLAKGLSNHEIAERLVISVGTTKSHVHHILEKTGCGSRMEAVAFAREQGLL